jgi:hypothetical protein
MSFGSKDEEPNFCLSRRADYVSVCIRRVSGGARLSVTLASGVSRRIYITIAFVLAIVATVVGWSQSLNYKITPPVPLALWFPLIVITHARDLAGVAVSFIQFPLFAVAFAFGLRRWPPARIVIVLVLVYALLALIAFAIVRSR